MNSITIHTAANGLRIVHMHVPRARVGHFGVAVRAGSRNELNKAEEGLAHFVEHTIFKGTERRSAWHILNRMESVGGELGAFTTKEDTVVYTVFPRGSAVRAVELVVDLIKNSRFPEKEIERERGVVCDEIYSYLDSPADAVLDSFEDRLYEGSPLGHNILGSIESVRGITGDMCRSWLRRNYTADNMVVYYAGYLSPESFLRKATPYLQFIPALMSEQTVHEAQNTTTALQPRSFDIVTAADTHQAHTVLGCSLPLPDIRGKVTLALLTNMLGGPGMNSLLNVALRERRGLVYNIESNLANWTDGSMFTVYFGCEPENNELCVDLVRKEIDKLAEKPLSDRRLSAARKQYMGQLLVARENTESRISGAARALLLHGRTLSVAETTQLLNDITPIDISRTAAALTSLSRLTMMPR